MDEQRGQEKPARQISPIQDPVENMGVAPRRECQHGEECEAEGVKWKACGFRGELDQSQGARSEGGRAHNKEEVVEAILLRLGAWENLHLQPVSPPEDLIARREPGSIPEQFSNAARGGGGNRCDGDELVSPLDTSEVRGACSLNCRRHQAFPLAPPRHTVIAVQRGGPIQEAPHPQATQEQSWNQGCDPPRCHQKLTPTPPLNRLILSGNSVSGASVTDPGSLESDWNPKRTLQDPAPRLDTKGMGCRITRSTREELSAV